MTGLVLAVILASAASRIAVPRPAAPAGDAPTRARFIVSREDGARGFALPSHEAFGWSQRARLLPDGSTEITVVADPGGVGPVAAASPGLPPEARATLAGIAALPDDVRQLAGEIVAGSQDDWDTAARVLTWVSMHVRHADEPPHADDSASTLRSRVGSCVGRSLLAADLLRAAGIPARTIHGLLATPDGPAPFLLHRFVEAWIDGLGWVPSDPGESIHAVDARHVFIAVEDLRYDPEIQRGLRLRIAEFPSGAAVPGTGDLRPLRVASRPPSLRAGQGASGAFRGLP